MQIFHPFYRYSCRRQQWKRIQLRLLSSTKSKGKNNYGPPENKVRAIPFTQHIKAAETVFDDFHGQGFFSVRVANAGPPEEIFLPFWMVSATVRVQLKQAQVGRNVITHQYNAATRRMEPMYTTEWAWIPSPTQYTFTRQYLPAAHPNLQIYGSHKYRRGLLNGIRQGHVTEVQAFTPDLLDRPSYNDMDSDIRNIQRKVDPYTIYPTTALRFARSYIESNEEKEMDTFLCNTFAADKTRLVDMEISITNIQVSPVYFPAYVFTVDYLGRRLRTFVNGNNLSVGGMRAYNWRRVAICSAATMTGLIIINGGIGWGGASGSFWIGVVLPSVVASMFALYYPLISLRIQDAIRQQEMKNQAKDPKIWDTDWTFAYDTFENEQRYRSWRAEQQAHQQRTGSYSSSGVSSDPKGYYAALNVSPNATKADIQSAFRGLAMKYHPDRYTDPKKKEEAKKKFQVISNAYSVLRDTKKRKLYDNSGSS
ncbi:uncharacterized protein BX664DRAFT_297573 [Halteromyces radiatus]|uniref:uncharacterized protein n=1 Tax=Halteromyces radiatus TaxID=101107 RepID=UPI00221E9763|nr:uncharacterized protein BX664DRAFT_297573 [Halteromyces radiatus]KAI8089688.1 hypothetical protein BX664DRAFT_297573 [Halteromyces radiatus]